MSDTNGNGTGPGSGTRGKLIRLLDHHEAIAAAIRTTLELLDGEATAKKQRRAPDMITQAIALDAARRHGGTRATAGRPKKKKVVDAAAIRARRKRTLALLDTLSTTTPRPIPGGHTGRKNPIGTLLRHGLIKRSGDGYIRTAKPFTVEQPPH
jgi:hypothetical protein